MAWAKIDDRFFSHPKIRRAGKDAVLLYLAALTYSNEHLTEGFISEDVLPLIAFYAFLDDYKQSAGKLLDTCLWERCSNGYQIHDYFDYNPTKEQVEQTKILRAQAGSKGGRAKAANNPPKNEDDSSKDVAKDKQNHGNIPSPPLPLPEEEKNGANAPEPETPKEPPKKEPPQDLVLTATHGGRILHALLEVEFKAKGRRTPGKFPSIACRDKFLNDCEKRLGDKLKEAITRAMQKGITDITGIVDFTAKYSLNGNANGKQETPAPEVDTMAEYERVKQETRAKLRAAKAANHAENE